MSPRKLETPASLRYSSGLDLFRFCQAFARRHYGASQGQALLPSGARIYSYTRLRLLRVGVRPAIALDTTPLPQEVVQRFLQEVPDVAARLAADFGVAVRLLKQPEAGLRRFLASSPLLTPPELPWAQEHLQGTWLPLNQSWKQFWQSYWKTALQTHGAAIMGLLRPEQLLVAVIARSSDVDAKALASLRARLAEDHLRWPDGPPDDVFLYDEPLSDWVLRPLLTGAQLLDFEQALAQWTRQVPAFVQRRIAFLEHETQQQAKRRASQSMSASAQTAPPSFLHTRGTVEGTDALPAAMGRRMPLLPNGTVTAEALVYFATMHWRQTHASPTAQEIRLDRTPLQPNAFRLLLLHSIQGAEHLLWDEPQAIRSRSHQAEEMQQGLREALLPGRIRREMRLLRAKGRTPQELSLPRWEACETLLGDTVRTLEERLHATLVPASITRGQLDTLVEQTPPLPSAPYLYDRPFGAWCRTALPAFLFTGKDLLDYCQSLATSLGDWPAEIAGAPASPAAAARAICWYTKLALEARIGPAVLREATSSQALPPTRSPQRADGGLVVWLDDPLPAAALDLATLLAPRIARVLHHMVWHAAQASQPFLLTQLKMGDGASWDAMERFLQRAAHSIGHPDPDHAAWEAAEKLRTQLLYLLLPADVSAGYLAGDQQLLQAAGWFDGQWYQQKQSTYQCLAEPRTFALSFLRFPRPVSNPPGASRSSPGRASRDAREGTLADAHEVRLALERISQNAVRRDAGKERSQGLSHGDQITLLRLLQVTPTTRRLIANLAHQQIPAALDIEFLWKTLVSDTLQAQEDITEETVSAVGDTWSGEAALARLLSQPDTAASPGIRRALADLFATSVQPEQRQQGKLLSMGTLERVGALTFRPPMRAVVLMALEALGHLAEKQRQQVCLRLLKRTDMILLLTILEESGWQRPPWLAAPAQEQYTQQRAIARGGVQLLHFGRMNWAKRVSVTTSHDAWRARAMIQEWLGLHFWSGLWQRSETQQALSFYQVTLAALPEALRLVVGAAWQLAHTEHLAHLPELLGLIGSLPPQLPAQLDSMDFFRTLSASLAQLPSWKASQEDLDPADADEVAAQRLRRQLQVARCRILAWVTRISGLQQDQEYRVLLAATVLAQGRPERLERWLQGAAPSLQEAEAMCQQIQQWQHNVALAPEELLASLQLAGKQLYPVWQRLRRTI